MKKYLSIFLVFFLLFGFSVPAFAETTSDVIPPVLDSPYDSYIISNVTSGSGSSATHWYYCWIYDSSVWDIYVKPNDTTVRAIFFGDEYSSPLRRAFVEVDDYNSSSSNNGWSFINTTPSSGTSSVDGSKYYYYIVNGIPFSSNRDIPFGEVNWDTNSLNYTGEFFFTQNPLVMEVGKALAQFQIQTSQNLMIIVLCGVGCLAFLISLPILRKVLLQFLNR